MDLKPADSFPKADPDTWHAAASKSLRGRAVESLRRKTDSGFELASVYFAPQEEPTYGSEIPGSGSYRRGAVSTLASGWDLRSRIEGGGPDAVNRRAHEALEGGASSLELVTESLGIRSAEQLNQALEGIYLDLAPLALEPGADFGTWVGRLCEVWTRREHDPALVEGAWNIDPLALALSGRFGPEPDQAFGASLDEAVASAAQLAVKAAQEWPKVRALRASSTAVHLAGCSDAQELATVMATAVHYLRAMETAGLDLERGFGAIAVGLQLDADVFAGIAKLRAARVLWARLAQACDAQLGRGAKIQAHTARRMFVRREQMTNALRATSAVAAGALGGADVITALPYDAATGMSARAARLARNTQVILREESHLDHVVDSAGGSWYLEERTDALVRAAWGEFQAIEAAGGIVDDLKSGRLQRSIRDVSQAREERIRHRKQTLVGVSDFARLDDSSGGDDGKSRTANRDAPGPLPVLPLDAEFERFRAASDRHLSQMGVRPQIWLANLGTLAEHGARTTFCRNLLAAGGIEAVDAAAALKVQDLGSSMADSLSETTPVAVLCSTDARYEVEAEPAAAALLAAGARAVFCAGHPGDRRTALSAAGFTGFLHLGMDVIALFEDLFQLLGVELAEGGGAGQ